MTHRYNQWVDHMGWSARHYLGGRCGGSNVRGATQRPSIGGGSAALRGRPFGRLEHRDGSASDRPVEAVPRLVIIGAQRAGTTSLSQWIMAHPRTRSPRTWELHYFDLEFRQGSPLVSGQLPLGPSRTGDR